jgi:hypothetical protein
LSGGQGQVLLQLVLPLKLRLVSMERGRIWQDYWGHSVIWIHSVRYRIPFLSLKYWVGGWPCMP